MFELIYEDLTVKKRDNLKLKKSTVGNPLEKSFDNIIDQINQDIVKILKYFILFFLPPCFLLNSKFAAFSLCSSTIS